MRYFAHAVPGLGGILTSEVEEAIGSRCVCSSDGRNDVVAFETRSLPALRCAEDVFAEIAKARRARHPGRLAAALLPADGLERALSAYANVAGGLRSRMGFRVVVRLRSEDHFRRTDLRAALYEHLAAARPRWRAKDVADIEIWVGEEQRGWRSGARLTSGPRSRRTSRTEERAGALRPSVAAAMVRLAGAPTGRLLDPFCGTGTILIEALAAGWHAFGSDIDPAAARLAMANTTAPITIADARDLPFGAGTFGAVVSNLPFGKRFASLQTDDLRRSLARMADAARASAPIVLLAPEPLERAIPAERRVADRIRIRLLGQPTVLWRLG